MLQKTQFSDKVLPDRLLDQKIRVFIHRRCALVDENQRIALKILEKACRRINRKDSNLMILLSFLL